MHRRLSLALGLVAACHTDPIQLTDPERPPVGTTSTVTPLQPTWDDIAGLLQARCVQCHRHGQIATYEPLDTYEDVVEREVAVRRKLTNVDVSPQMPPYPGGETSTCDPPFRYVNDLRLPQQDVERVLSWFDAGAPIGYRDPEDALPPSSVTPLADPVEYPFESGYRVEIHGAPPPYGSNMRDTFVCRIVDPQLAETGALSGIAVEPDWDHLFRGMEIRLDLERESLAFVGDGAPGEHGEDWYLCDDGFGFVGQLLTSFQGGTGTVPGRKGETAVVPFVVPEGAAVPIPAGALLVARTAYHIHQANLDADDTGPVPYELSWVDHTSIALDWASRSSGSRSALLWHWGNTDDGMSSGEGGLFEPPFEIPAGGPGETVEHSETMVSVVPGTPNVAYAVFSVQPGMRGRGKSAEIWAVHEDEPMCLGAVPRWDALWQLPMLYGPKAGEYPVVFGGDTLVGTCGYVNGSGEAVELGAGPFDELCEFTVGLLPL